jgi:hypothetical protein
MRRFGLSALGVLVMLAGAFLFFVPVGYTDSEKPFQLYRFGHWFDVPWEVGLPLAIAGGVMLAVGLRRAFRSRRP